MGTSIASAAERVPGAEKAPIALIKGMNGEVVGGQLEKVPAKSAWGGRFPGTPGSGVYGGMTPLEGVLS